MEFFQGLKDLWYDELPPIPESAERTNIWPFTGNPKEWIDRTDPDYTPSIYADSPTIDVTGSGVINPVGGATKGAISALRKMMASENVARGKPLKGIVDRMSRGLWLHGRSQYPKTGETFADSRIRVGNLGEPYGLSLTANKELLEHNFAKAPIPHEVPGEYTSKYALWNALKTGKLAKSANKNQVKVLKQELIDMVENVVETDQSHLRSVDIPTPKELYKQSKEKMKKLGVIEKDPSVPFARVFPKFGGAPEDKILPAWVAPETEWSQKIIKDTYIESLPESIKDKFKKILKFKGQTAQEVEVEIGKFHDKMLKKYNASYNSGEWGLKDEWHLKELRKKFDATKEFSAPPNIQSLFEDYENTQLKHGPTGLSHLQEESFSSDAKHNFNKRISDNLQKKGYKALLYSPERYGEYEMRMLNPDDVSMLDMRKQKDPALKRMYHGRTSTYVYDTKTRKLIKREPGSQHRRLREWKSQAAPREGASLRNIYEKITWEDVERVLGPKVDGKSLADEMGLRYLGEADGLEYFGMPVPKEGGGMSETTIATKGVNKEQLIEKINKTNEAFGGNHQISNPTDDLDALIKEADTMIKGFKK